MFIKQQLLNQHISDKTQNIAHMRQWRLRDIGCTVLLKYEKYDND